MQNINHLQTPISKQEILSLRAGESIFLSGVICTARDAVHRWLVDTFVDKKINPTREDEKIFEEVGKYLSNGAIYHCGPIVSKDNYGNYQVLSAGPTTSIRQEAYEAEVIKLFGIKAIIGKGGMGEKTLAACSEFSAVYLHAIGGAGVLLGKTVKKVLGVYKLDFGVPEAIWVMEVDKFPAVITMDAHGNSLHSIIEDNSRKILEQLLQP